MRVQPVQGEVCKLLSPVRPLYRPTLVPQGKNPTLSSEATSFSPQRTWHSPAVPLDLWRAEGANTGAGK